MSSLDKEILKLLRRIRDRIHTGIIVDYTLLGIAFALAFGLVLAIAARFTPIYAVYTRVFYLTAAMAGGAMLFAAFSTPDNRTSALRADSMGLNERVVTALELIGVDSIFATLEKKDALDKLQSMDIKKKLPIQPNKRYAAAVLILAMAVATTGFIPNPMSHKARELHHLREKTAAKQKQVEEAVKKVEKNVRLTEEQKKQMEQTLEEIKKVLREVKNEKDLEKALFKAEKKLEQIKDKYNNTKESMKKLAEALQKNLNTSKLAKAIEKKDENAVKQEIKNMADSLKNLSNEERQELQKSLSELAEALKNSPELREALGQLAQKLSSGNAGDLSPELNQLGDAIAQLMEDEDMRSALEQISESMNNQGQNSGTPNQSSQGDNGHQSGAPGNSQGGGQSGSQGSQGSQGKGAGGGAGSGTDMGQENPTPVDMGNAGIGRKDGSVRKSGEYEKIFTSKTLGGDGEKTNLSGQKGSGGSTEQIITDKSNAVRGASVPYNQVIGEYKQSAFQSINTSSIPEGMKDLIKDYFSSLDE